MKRLGKALHVSRPKILIVKAKIAPPLYSKVYDGEGRILGQVIDIFGPVKEPYVAVKVADVVQDPRHLIGKVFFMKASM